MVDIGIKGFRFELLEVFMFVFHEFLNGWYGGAGTIGYFDNCFVYHCDVGCSAVGGFDEVAWDFGGDGLF